ncbi:hypothetical protein [Stenotrophomonas maltophilia]|uniref:hypothetical protein n=1 Tax=Stenotrophomonas maltophilia TaxID=40324 RepID=UPI0013D93FA8|nr:hypothetical protein [Stenotrophomonas maltophilia]
MNQPNIIAVPTQDVVGYKVVTNIPIPLPRWLAIKAAIRASAGAPWLLQQLAPAALGVSASAGLGLLSSSATDRDKLILLIVAISSLILAAALYAGVREQRKVKQKDVDSIIEAMDAVEEPFDLPPCNEPADVSLAGRLRAAMKAFNSPS